jgi:hypothetical protein
MDSATGFRRGSLGLTPNSDGRKSGFMNISNIGRTTQLLVAAIIGGLVSQIAPLTMQLHAQTNAASATTAATPGATTPVTTTKQFGVIDISGIKTESDMANALSNAQSAGWKLKMGLGNYAVFTK